jgi:hypothetical protein
MRKIIPWIVVGCLCLIALPAYSQNILVWDKDHDLKFQDPEGAGSVDGTYGVTKALCLPISPHTTFFSSSWETIAEA